MNIHRFGKAFALCFGLAFTGSVSAQTMYNNGAVIAIMNDAVVIVKTDGVTSQSGSLENDANTNGILKNKGQLILEGSFINSSGTADGFGANSGEYIVYQDWINNALFNADQSKVFLRGNNQQITGSNVTTFYDLICETAGSKKTQTLDAKVSNTFTLNNNELATQDYKLFILNPDPNAIIVNGVNDAFVSSTNGGRLVRATNSTSAYLFPVGWDNAGNPIIREITISPSGTIADNYYVRMAFNTGSTTTTTDDGYNINTKKLGVELVNDKFYHLLNSDSRTAADLAIHYDISADGDWQSIGRWQNGPQWENLKNTTVVPGSPRYQMTRLSWVPTADEAHALLNMVKTTRDFAFPNVFAPQATGTHEENTFFGIINQGGLVTLEELSVYNRWGEMVYNNRRDGRDTWNGFFQGKLQQQGNYVFLAKVRNNNTGQLYPIVTGNVTLLW